VGTKNAQKGSEPEPKEVEHGGKVIPDRILILLISKADEIMTRHNSGQAALSPCGAACPTENIEVVAVACRAHGHSLFPFCYPAIMKLATATETVV
jgi:hypothetical protein